MTDHQTSGTATRRRPGPWSLLAALIGVLALVAAACGDGGDDGDGGGGGGQGASASECPVDALEDSDGTAEVTVWHAYVGLTAKTLERMAEDYNASQDKVRVSVEAQGTYEELLKKYEDTLADPRNLPDIVLAEDTTTQFMIDSQSVIPAQSCIEADPDAEAVYDDFLPAVTAAYTVEDVLWPGAFSVSNPVLYYNNDHFRAAGLDPANPPKTLAELRTAAETIKAANIEGVTEPLVLKVDSWYIEHWLTGVHQPIVNNANGRDGLATESEFDNDTTDELYSWLKSMVDDGLLKSVPNSSQIDHFLAAATQSSSMLIETSTAITTVNGVIEGTLTGEDLGVDLDLSTVRLPDLDISVGDLPGLKGPSEGQIGGSAWYIVDSGDDATIAGAWDFLSWFNETPQQVRWTLEASYLPVRKSAIDDPTLQADFNSTRKGGWLAVATNGTEQLDPDFPGPVIGPYKEFRATVRASLEELTLSGKGVDEAVASANRTFQEALDRYAEEVGG